MGIANNLNPMVESFQRLAATEGGTKKALQAMISGLAGPAGIGVAIGVVSSLAVTFSKEISEFFKGPTDELHKFRDELNKVSEEIYKIIGQEQTKRTKGIFLVELITGGNATQQQEALKQLKKLYGDNKAIQDAKLGADKAFYTTLVNQAAMQNSAVDTEKNNAAQLDKLYAAQLENEKKTNDKLSELDKGVGLGFFKAGKNAYKNRIDELKVEVNNQYDILGKEIEKDIAKLEANTFKQLSKITLIPTPDTDKSKAKVKESETSKILKKLQEETKSLQYQLDEGLIKKLPTSNKDKESYYSLKINAISDAIKKLAGLTGGEAKTALASLRQELSSTKIDEALGLLGKKRLGEASANKEKSLDPERTAREFEMLDKEVNTIFIKGQIAKEKELSKILKQQEKDYENFANTIANSLTNAVMGLWDAMESGKSVGDALTQIFSNLVKQIAAAVIQATIFEAILTAFPELKALFAASGSITNALGFSGKHADGGITNGASIGMIGEAGPEAIIPLSKLSSFLNTSFNAGAMSGNSSSSNGGQFVLRGQDLLVAINRTQKSSALKGQNISLA
jgi:hypothetical protein